jgi:hypothetical protein
MQNVTESTASNGAPECQSRKKALDDLLNADLEFPPEYRGGLSNHLPMALHSLYELGASSQRLREFYTIYSQRFATADLQRNSEIQVPSDINWLQFRGLSDSYPTLLGYFDGLILRNGMEGTLEKTLPDLLPGVSAAAFHGVIRTAHALQAKHAREMAAALAYWAWRWQPLESTPTGNQLLPFDMWSQRLVEQAKEEKLENSASLITVRMDEACQTITYRELAGLLAPTSSLKQRIVQFASFAVNRYLASRNFTVLHMVTGARALRILLPWIDDTHEAQLLVAQCLTAAYLAAEVAPANGVEASNLQGWQAITDAAIQSNNEHAIKMVHTCRDEASVYASDQYLNAANMAMM